MKNSQHNNAKKSPGLIRGTAIVSFFTLISRVLGFIRDLLFARLFGAGLVADAFFVAFRIPNLLRSIMAEGALTSGFVPVFSDELRRGHKEAQSAITSVTSLLVFASVILSLLGILYSKEITTLFAPGFLRDPEKFLLASELLQIMFPYVIFVSLVAMLGGALNSVQIFGTAAMAQVIMNVVFIIGILIAMQRATIAPYIIAWTVLVGGIAQVLYQLPALKKAGFVLSITFKFLTPATKKVLLLMLPAIFGAAVYQVSIFFNTIFASFLIEGSVSWLFYADRISQFPIGIYSIALASVLLPALSHAQSDNDQKLFSTNLYNSLRYTSFLMIPISAAIILLAEPIISLLFERGEFTRVATINTAQALTAYAFGLWGISCHTMVVRSFIAKKDTVTPTLIGILMLTINLLFSIILIGPVNNFEGSFFGGLIVSARELVGLVFPLYSFGHVGLALASSISGTIGFILISFIFSKGKTQLLWLKFSIGTFKNILAALSAYSVALTVIQGLSPLWAVLIGGAAGLMTFIAAGLILKIVEIQETFQILKRIHKWKG